MEPVSAFGLAASVIQVVDFTSRLISQSKEIYQSTSGTLETCSQLEDAAKNLTELCQDLQKHTPKSQHNVLAKNAPSISDKQLLDLSKQCERETSALIKTLQRLKGQGRNKRWQSVRQAIRFAWSEKEIAAFERKLDSIRKRIDTALLRSLRERIDSTSKDDEKDSKSLVSSFIEINKAWQAELLTTIKKENWNDENDDDVRKFADRLNESTLSELKEQFCSMIYARLHFSSMSDRLESIANAYRKTFEWLYRKRSPTTEDRGYDSFTDWLGDGSASSIYWVTGKPGSGKSTLMKYLYHDPRSDSCLKKWSNGTPIIKLGFFFWNSGTPMQMSRTGLLQSILHDALRDDSETTLTLFHHRWKQYLAFGGGRAIIDWPELRRAFQTMVSDTTRKFFLVLDGLDEFDGNPKELVDLILGVSRQPNVKICTSSRPWVIFEDELGNRPSLCLERLTYGDIHHYVTSRFNENKHYQRLSRIDGIHASKIVREVVDKANGVFLWVYLVVDSLLEGLSHSDKTNHLQSRLDALPSDLEELFDKILNRLEPEYYTHACQFFRLIHHHPNPTLLELYFADYDDVQSGLKADIRSLNLNEQLDRQEEIRRRLKSRCKGFLESSVADGPRNLTNQHIEDGIHVRYFHRTAKDFVESENTWEKIIEATSSDDFDPDERWANSALWILKSGAKTRTVTSSAGLGDSEYVHWALECVLRLEKNRQVLNMTYLNEVDRVLNYLYIDPDHYSKPLFLELAVWCQLRAYMQIKLEVLSQEQRKRLFDFNLGLVTGYSWSIMPADHHTMLRSLYDKGRKETGQLLRYYCTHWPWKKFRSKPKMDLRIV